MRRENGQVLENFNPLTRTYFKCSIYSPSNRLYTVDEVNSTLSGDNYASSLVTTGNKVFKKHI